MQPNSRSVAARSGWIWNPRAWQDEPEEVFAHARKYGIKTLFISVPQTEGRIDDADQLSSFIHAAARRDVEVWAVDGDPQMVVPGEHAATIRRMRAYAAYNAAVPVAARLRGVQFDIEPYLLPGYDVAAADWDRRYLELVRGLHAAAGALPLEMVVPFWWSDKAELLKSIAPYISGLSVMDYRTQPDEIRRFAIPFLDWGAVHGKQVRIALEAGPVEGEQHRRYTRSSSGELWLVQAGQAHFIILLKEPGSNPAGAAFRFSASWTSDGSTTSFRSNPGRLIGLLPALEQDFSAWDSFRGMALHELK